MAVHWGGRGYGHTSRWTAAASGGTPTPTPINSIAADGWQAEMITPADLTFAPVTMSRQGYDATGATATFSEGEVLTKLVRQPYPDQASLTADIVAVSDNVYSTDIVIGVTNNSTKTSPKPVANWAVVDRRVVGDTMTLEIVALHRNGVACVEFSVSDGTTTVTQKVSAMTVSPEAGDQCAVLVYRAVMDISTLTDNVDVTANAKVYPRIGAGASVADSSTGSAAREFSPRVWRRNTARAATPPLVYVASSGNDSTGYVGPDAGLAAASPCLTPTGAINRARTVLGTGAGSLDGLRVRLIAGTWSLAANPTANTVNAAIVIEPAPGVAKADAIWSFGGSANRPNITYVVWSGLTLTRAGTNPLYGTGTSTAVLHDAILDNNSQTVALASTATGIYLTGGTVITNWTSGSILNAATTEIRMLRGVMAGAANAGHSTEGHLWLGCDLSGMRFAYGARSPSGGIVAFNKLMRMGSAAGPTLMVGVGDTTDGFALVQNVIEYTSTASNAGISLSADGAPNNTKHFICWHNTLAGFDVYGRGNILYDETAADPRTHELHSFVGNLHVQVNTKHDVFMTDGTRIGGWSYLYGVGSRGEFSRYRDAGSGSFAQEFAGQDSVTGTTNTGAGLDPLFTAPAHTTSGPVAGAGGGDYTLQPGSPARGLVSASPLPFDLTGAARTGLSAVGAYV